MMARHYGFPVSSITLHFLGGMTAIEGEATKLAQEFMDRGRLHHLDLVGAASLGLWFVVPDGLLQMAVGSLAAMNLFVGVLNLVPGLPLDGGRVLKAIVWGTTGNMHCGTIVVAGAAGSRGGRARLAAGHGAAPGHRPHFIDFVLAFVVATFLWSGATAAMASARLRRRLPALVARDLARRTLAVPDDLPLAEASVAPRRRRRAAS